MKNEKVVKLFLSVCLLAMIFVPLHTALAGDKGVEDLAKASQNPVSSLISVPFETNINFNAGPEDETDVITNIKPVVPMSLTKNWNLINRIIIPAISQGSRGPGLGREFGLGDITYQGFISPAEAGKVIWGIGPQIGMPTGMDRATSDHWTLGPSAVVLVMPGKWVIGALVSNVWNIGDGYNDAADVNALTFQYFINYNMPGGWYLSMAPTITANWEADSDNTWTIPVGGAIGRVFKIGKQPVNMKAGAYYNVEKPDNASDWTLQFGLTFMFPK